MKPSGLWAAALLLRILFSGPSSAHAAAVEARYAVMKVLGEGGGKLELPLKQTRIRAAVTDTDAVTDVSQSFKNDTGKKIETLYQFPLPENGAVTDLVVKINDRVIFGQIKERGRAKAEFEEARAAGRTAALVEQERPNFFTQSLANIQPGDQIDVTLRVHHPLRYSVGAFEYAFPVTVGPRYMSGAPTGKSGEGWSPDTSAVPDASRVSPPYLPAGMDSSHFLEVELTLKTGIAVSKLESTSHQVDIRQLPDGSHRVTLAAADRIPNKDFIFRYSTASTQPQVSLQTHRDAGEDGFFSLTLVPPSIKTSGKIMPKELVFIIDRSGSMHGAPMEKAKQALKSSLNKLGPADSFNVVAFDNQVESLYKAPKRATAENLRQAQRFTEAIGARGGTEMEAPLMEALHYPKDPRRQRIVLFITDGNVGNEQGLITSVKAALGDSRIFAVGIGSAVNRYLVGEIARQGRGVAEYIRQDEDVNLRLSSIYQKIANPVLTGVKLDFGGLETAELYPEKVRDLFFDEPTVILGRFKTAGKAVLTVKAESAGGKVSFSQAIEFPAESKVSPSLPYAWARRKIDALGLTAMGHETEALKKEITALSIRYSVLSKYTAFLAVAREVRGDAKAPAERWIIPSELPEGLRFDGFGPEIQLKVSRVRPGDPEIFVRAPENAKAVVALMPYGEHLSLSYDKKERRYSARFLVPFGTPDGNYPFTVLVTDALGNTRSLTAHYVVDSKGPGLSFKARFVAGTLVVEAVPEADVFVTDDVEVWPDVKEVSVILPDGGEQKLLLEKGGDGGRFLWRFAGKLTLPAGPLTLSTRAVDYAGNWKVDHVRVEN